MSESIRTGQQQLFIETFAEAIDATAARCGGKKALACAMRPDLADDPEGAGRWLLDALNPDRRQEIHVKHLLRALKLAGEHDCHILKHWLDRATGYSESEPASLMTPRQRLALRRQRNAAEARELADEEAELDRKEAMADVRALRKGGA